MALSTTAGTKLIQMLILSSPLLSVVLLTLDPLNGNVMNFSSVFLNGQGMTCQYVNFQKKQLEKGMPYVLELIARRFNVNPGKLVWYFKFCEHADISE